MVVSTWAAPAATWCCSRAGCRRTTEELQVAGYYIALPAGGRGDDRSGGGTVAGWTRAGLLRAGPHSAALIRVPLLRQGRRRADGHRRSPGARAPGPPTSSAGTSCSMPAWPGRRSRRVARPLVLSVEQAALAVLRVVNQQHDQAIKMLSLERGHDPRSFVLVAVGAAGSTPAPARELSMGEAYSSPGPASCAASCSAPSTPTCDMTTSRVTSPRCCPRLGPARPRSWSRCAPLPRPKRTSEGFPAEAIEYRPALGLRYAGQQWQIPIDVVWPLGPGFLPLRRRPVPRAARGALRFARPRQRHQRRRPAPRRHRSDDQGEAGEEAPPGVEGVVLYPPPGGMVEGAAMAPCLLLLSRATPCCGAATWSRDRP